MLFSKSAIKEWKELRNIEDAHEEPEEMPKLLKSSNSAILAFIEEFPEKLVSITGVGGRPLAYVIREDATVPDLATDPMYGHPDSVYESIREEVIRRAAHTGSIFKADNGKVFEILRDAIAEHDDVKVWIKGFVKKKDGRGAWESFKAHFLGTAQLDTIADRADSRIETLVYNGEKPRYTFETHVSNFKKAHLDLARASTEPDERTKVRKFLQSIKAPELQTAVGVVKSQDIYLKDFELTINYLRRFVSPSIKSNRTVAAVGTQRDTEEPPKPAGISWRWYPREEFKKLPEDAQQWLI